jgi:small neutral amino acid transporter SnatA (MarC family)
MAKHNRSLFLSMILGNNNRVSSKRVLGSFVITTITIMVVDCVFVKEDASWLSSAIDTLIITGGALLGLGIADTAFIKKNENQNGKYNSGGRHSNQKVKTNDEDHCDDYNG